MNSGTADMSQGPSQVAMPKGALIGLMALCLVAVGAVVFLVLRPPSAKPEVILAVTEARTPAEAQVPVLNVVDTLADPNAKAVVGGRYKVRMADNAREGSSGIARIGGLVTFVPDTRKGDLAIIEVTRLKRSTADATLIERLSETPAPAPAPTPASPAAPAVATAPAAPTPSVSPQAPAPATSGLMGNTYRGNVEVIGKEGDGIVKVNGKTVFIKGVTLGQYVEFKVTSDKARIAFGELLSVLPKPETPAPAPAPAPAAPVNAVSPTTPASPAPSGATTEAKPAAQTDYSSIPLPAVGSEYVVTVTEKDRREPLKNGVARMNRLVVFVPGTQPGDRVRIRIAEHMRRAVRAEVIERLPPEAPAPAPTSTPQPAPATSAPAPAPTPTPAAPTT